MPPRSHVRTKDRLQWLPTYADILGVPDRPKGNMKLIYIAHNYTGHNYMGHNYMGHNYTGHT